jgi:integrase
LGRNRKKAYQQLPKYFYVNRGRIVYRPPGAKNIVVGPDSMAMSEVWTEYEKLTTDDHGSIGYIAGKYYQHERYLKLKSRKVRKRNLNKILSKIGAHAAPEQIQAVTLRDYLDWRVKTSKHMANHEFSALSAMWSWAMEYGYIQLPNPCSSVRMFPTPPRTRLVKEPEYKSVYDIAPDHIKVAMELAYLCRMRRNEVLDVRVKDMEEDGLNTRRLKGSNDALTLWSPRLKKAVNLGLKGKIRVPDMLVVTFRNTNVRPNTFSTQFKKLIDKSGVEPFTFHDLKAMGVSDFDGDKKLAGGHKNEAMVAIYDRKRKEVGPTR